MYDDSVAEVLSSGLARDEKKKQLRQLYLDARAQQRAASESAMIDMDGLNDRLRQIELAAKELGIELNEPEDGKAATL